jgi:hypothetical protein
VLHSAATKSMVAVNGMRNEYDAASHAPRYSIIREGVRVSGHESSGTTAWGCWIATRDNACDGAISLRKARLLSLASAGDGMRMLPNAQGGH